MSRTRLSLFLASLLAALPTTASAQLANMVRDIETHGVSGSSAPNFLGFVSSTAYFDAYVPTLGHDLWESDGTPEGTRVVGDGCAGGCAKFYTALAQTEDRLFLAVAYDHISSSPQEILVASGDPPKLSTVLSPPQGGYFPYLNEDGSTELLDGALLFWMNDGTQAAQLYSARGAGAELTLLARLEHSLGLGRLQRSGALVYFWNYPDVASPELWVTDGTSAGTRRIREFSDEGSTAVETGLGSQTLVFAAGGPEGSELWSSDGSSQGTRPLTSLVDPSARIWSLASTGTRGYFLVEDVSFGQEIWQTDGTPAGTRAVTSFGYHMPFGEDPAEDELLAAGGRAYFFASDGINGLRLWATSPSGGSASDLIDVCEGGYCSYDPWLVAIGSQVFFQRQDAEHGIELWTTDGSIPGTLLFDDACPGTCDGFGRVLTASAGRLVYTASSAADAKKTIFLASAPWQASLSLYDPVRRGPVAPEYAFGGTIDSGDEVYFAALDSHGGIEPWLSGGTPQTTLQLADIWGSEESSSYPHDFAAVGDNVAFRAYPGSPGFGEGLWLTRGSADSTRHALGSPGYCLSQYFPLRAVSDRFMTLACWQNFLSVEPESSAMESIPAGDCYSPIAFGSNDEVAIGAFDCPAGTQIWKSDGTAAGTHFTATLPSGFGVQSPLWSVGDHFLFVGGSQQQQLYSLTSNLSAFVPLTDADEYFDSEVYPQHENLAFFVHGTRLRRTDGTPAGTFAVGPTHDYLRLRAAVRAPAGYDLLVRNEFNFYEVWTSDGTDSGTASRTSIGPLFDSNAGVALDRAGDDLYFILGAYGEPQTLWTLTDGSSEARALHIAPPSESNSAAFLAHRGDREYFRGCDAGHGCELWVTQGSEGTTRLVHDVYPGPSSSDPAELFTNGDLLYFTADDGLHGRELWVLPLDGGPPCRANERTLCLEDARFQVTSRWSDFQGRSGDATAVPISSDTGYFWFFDEDNVELILKLIDGGGFNGHHWVYYGALSNVEYTFTVTDSQTGAAKRYFNPATRFASSGDITAFGPNGAHAAGGPSEAETLASTPPEVSLAAFSAPLALPGTCVPTPTRFCILNNRFAVTATWRDFAGHTGTANAGTLTDDTGYLWFFNEANVEVVLKMVDAEAFNQHFWVYYGALSNVEYTLTVTDTVAGGPPRVYRNPLGQFGSFGDIEAFPAP